MTQSNKLIEILIGLSGAGFALVVLLVWIPADIDTGLIDVWRRTIRIGDAMLPTFAATGILLTAIAIAVRALLNRGPSEHREASIVYLLAVFLILVVSLTLMWVTGPFVVGLLHPSDVTYRMLIATVPWKYLGFMLGGTVLTVGFIALSQHKLNWRQVGIAVLATLAIALLYDLPFDNLYLPPNGDF